MNHGRRVSIMWQQAGQFKVRITQMTHSCVSRHTFARWQLKVGIDLCSVQQRNKTHLCVHIVVSKSKKSSRQDTRLAIEGDKTQMHYCQILPHLRVLSFLFQSSCHLDCSMSIHTAKIAHHAICGLLPIAEYHCT